jgi:hypothetical protein
MPSILNMKNKLQQIVLEILRADDRPTTFGSLETRVAEILRTQDEGWKRRTPLEDHLTNYPQGDPQLKDDETPLLQEIYWDLFLEKRITFGHDTSRFYIHSEAPKF